MPDQDRDVVLVGPGLGVDVDADLGAEPVAERVAADPDAITAQNRL